MWISILTYSSYHSTFLFSAHILCDKNDFFFSFLEEELFPRNAPLTVHELRVNIYIHT